MLTEKQYTVLLIDNSAVDRATYCRYLQRSSSHTYHILEADSAAVGLDLYRRSLPDAILLDYALPDIDGLEFLTVLMQQERRQRVPVLMLTGQGRETIAVQAIKNGAQDYLIKGTLTADGLCKAVMQSIEQFQLQQRLRQQEQQQQIVSAIAVRIRQSLQLEEILATTVTEVRQFLDADRVVVYQFQPDLSGTIITESVLPGWTVTLGHQLQDTCFRHHADSDHRASKKRAIDDIYQAGLTACHVQLLEQFEVKANLVAPIVVRDELWGLLIAHQCSAPRQWQATELNLLDQLVVQIAIALQHAIDYEQLQTELVERQRVEADLRTSEERLLLALRATNQGLYDLNMQTGEAIVTPEYATMLGYDPATFQETNAQWIERLHPDDRASVASTYQAYVAGEIPDYKVEFRQRMQTGGWKWIFSVGKIVERDATGQPLRMLGTHTDISDRKQTELMLQEANQQITSIWESMTDAYATLDHEWRFIYANQAATQAICYLTNLKPEEFLGKTHWEVFPSLVGQPIEQAYCRAIAEQVAVHLEVFYEPTQNWFEVHAYPSTAGLGVYFRDISDRKQAEADRLQATQVCKELKLLEAIFDIILAGYWDWDIPNNQEYLSPGFKRMFGYEDDELPNLPETRQRLIVEDDLPGVLDCFDRHVQSRGQVPYYNEVRYRHRDGSIVWVICSGRVIEWDYAGNPRRMIGCHIDITDRKQFEASLMQYERIISSKKDGVALLDRHYIYQVANQAYLTWCNKTHDDVIGHSVRDVLGSELFDNFIKPRLDQCLIGETVQYEKWFDYPNIVPQFLSVTYTPYLDVNQTIAGMIVSLRDITDRKEAEERLRKSDAHLRTAQRIAKLGSWEFDLRTKQITWSEEVFRLFGRDPETATPTFEELQQLIDLDDRDQHQQAVKTAVATLQPYEIEFRFYDPNGSLKYLQVRGEPIVDPTGQLIQLVGTVLDITDRKQAEEELRNLSDRLALAVKSGAIAIWDWNVVENILTWDDRMYELYGITPDQFTSVYDAWASSLHPDDRPFAEAAIQQALADEKDYDPEFRVVHPDGTIRFLKAYALVQRNAQGEPQNITGINFDVTNLKQAEEELRNLSDRLALAVKSGAIGIWDWNIKSNRINCDEQMYKLYGIIPDPLTSFYEGWITRLHPDDRPLTEAALQQAVAGEKDYDTEFRVVHPDGAIRFLKAYALVQRNEQGEPQRMIGINFDITASKQAESKLLQTTAQLEASNKELEAFAYSVSHDLRSPLRAIDGFSKALLEDYGDQFDEEGRDYFDRIRHNVKRMGLLIDDLLRLSRVSRSEMQYSAVNLSALVQEQVHELQALEPERQVTVVVAPRTIVSADATLMRVVISNLLQNAWKFTSHHATARIEFGVTQHDGQTTCFVRDDGAGFDMAYADMLFGVFQRLHNTHEFSGTGIGLATVQRAIHRHGGRVWAEGAVEQGATIYFTVPHTSITPSIH